MTSLVKCVENADYADIREGVAAVSRTVEYLHGAGVRIDIGHRHRFWEYGSAVQALLSVYNDTVPKLHVLDVGSGCGAIGPTLSYAFNTEVTECEPDPGLAQHRIGCNEALRKSGHPELHVHLCGFGGLPPYQYDAVFSISVIEHLPKDLEKICWKELVDHLKPNGLLFVTVDCVEYSNKPYVFDNLRAQNFTTDMIAQRVKELESYGMVPMGKPDYQYKGPHVHDYTFFRIGMIKNASGVSNDMEREMWHSRVR